MNDKTKLGLIAVLLIAGAIVIAKSIGGSSGNGKMDSADPSAQTAEGSAVDQTAEGRPHQDQTAVKATAGATADIDRIADIAKASMDEAMVTYQNYAGVVLREGAKNPESLNRLLNATVTLSEIDGANDHYMSLIEVADKYPAEFKKGVNAMGVSQEIKDEILTTAKSASASVKNGNG